VTHQVASQAASEAGVDTGVEGNHRLTSSTGLVLALILLVEGFTIFDVRGYITLHTVLGLALFGPVALKCAVTMYRFVRYYTGKPAYVRRGPPPILLRIMGPLLILSTLAVLGTGVALLVTHGRSDTWLTLHQGSFIAWVALAGIHFLWHLVDALRGTARDLRRRTTGPGGRRRAVRLAAVTASLVIGVGLAAAFTPAQSSWQMPEHDHGNFRDR
jgi:hypothetical protein